MSEKWMRYSISARLLIIGVIVLALMIPSFMIQSLIEERQSRRNEAISEVSDKWGGSQTITGPILSVPYTDYFTNQEGETSTRIAYAHILPEALNIEGAIVPELRSRGIYEVVLYNTELEVAGNFIMPSLDDLKVPLKDYIWKDAYISVGISDMKGIKELVSFQIDNTLLKANPGIESSDIVPSGVSRIIGDFSSKQTFAFNYKLNLNGSGDLKFSPVGKETNVSIKANWPNPSFSGHFLPKTHTITDQNFQASWTVLHLNRNFPQKWLGSKNFIENYAFGVKLLVPVDEYRKNMRTAKYAFMFISLTFLSFFMIELLNKKVMHPIQYLLIGFSLLVFYTLLLSISEHITFNIAYVISSLATIGLITTYTISVLKSRLQTIIIFSILVLLYVYLFIVIQLQDFALLIGSIGLFVILSAVMYLTRKIDWFSTFSLKESEPKG